MQYVRSFKELETYKRSREVSREIFIVSKQFPIEERFSLTDQIRRSSRSVVCADRRVVGKAPLSEAFRDEAHRCGQ